MIFVTSIKQNTTENEQKLIKKNQKRMKLYNKKIIMKINIIQLIFAYKKRPHLKFLS